MTYQDVEFSLSPLEWQRGITGNLRGAVQCLSGTDPSSPFLEQVHSTERTVLRSGSAKDWFIAAALIIALGGLVYYVYWRRQQEMRESRPIGN